MAEGNIFQSLKTSMLYVKFEDDDLSDEELYNHFKSKYPDGEIVSCKVGRGGSRKFAYVNYINHQQATIAIELLNATMLRNKPIKVKFSPGHKNNIGSIIYIKNFDKSLDKDYLHKLVSTYGNTLVIKLSTDASSQSTGSAVVQYDSVESAQTAMKALYGKLIMNKRLYVYTNEKLPGDDDNGNSIFLDIVPDRLPEHYLLETFSPFGGITRVRVYEDFPKGGLLGSVVFKDPASAAKAAEALSSGFNPRFLFVRRFWDRSHWERFQEEESNRLLLKNQRMSCGTEEEASGTDLDGIYSKV